jgi:hypothetical protein
VWHGRLRSGFGLSFLSRRVEIRGWATDFSTGPPVSAYDLGRRMKAWMSAIMNLSSEGRAAIT